MSQKIEDLIKQMSGEGNHEFQNQLFKINDKNSTNIKYNYMNVPLTEVINNPEEFIIPEILPACKLLWEKGIETYMCGNYDDVDGRWIELANVQPENQEILNELMKSNPRYSFVHHYVLRVPFGENEVNELCELVEPLAHQDTNRFVSSEEFLNRYKKTDGEYYHDECGQIKCRFNPLYANATLEQALVATNKINLYNADEDRVYENEIYMKWHQNYVDHTKNKKVL